MVCNTTGFLAFYREKPPLTKTKYETALAGPLGPQVHYVGLIICGKFSAFEWYAL